MKYSYVIIDDNDIDRTILSFYLKEFYALENKASFSNPNDGLFFFENNNVDVLFLDIEMPQLDGVSFLKKVQDKTKCAVFITSYPDYALESYELKAFDYIIKPLTKERISSCVFNIKEHLDTMYKAAMYERSFKKSSVLLKSGTNHVPVNLSDIQYLEGLKDYTRIKLLNEKIIVIHGNIGSIITTDENFSEFVRIHKSYAIHPAQIQMIKSTEIVLTTGSKLPLGASYKKKLLDELGNLSKLQDININL